MTVPKQVLETAELAEQLHNQMYSSEVTDNENVDTETSIEEGGPTPDVETIPEESVDDIEAKYEARYKTLQGKYNSEVPRLIEELRELKQSVFDRLEKATKPVETAPEIDDFASSFAENYGEDFAENLKKLISLEAAKLTQPVQKQLADVEDSQTKQAQNNFINYIDQNLNSDRDTPLDWQGLWAGNNPKFNEFLAKPDPSGLYTYGQLAEAYNNNWDADKLVTIFKLYESETQVAPVTPVPTTKPKPSPQQEALVAPSRSNTHVAPNLESKKIWTSDMLAEFQRLDRQGKYSPEESKALWDDCLSALAENRIR